MKKTSGNELGQSDGNSAPSSVETIPEAELWLHQNVIAKGLLARGLADAAQGKTIDGGDFSSFLDDENSVSTPQP